MAPPTFPPELHSMIIRLATYTPVYFDISPDPRFWPANAESYTHISADYPTKKALTLVSRQFRYVALPYLYEVVQVHKSSNIHLLADVLDNVSSGTTSSGQQNPRKIRYLFVSVLEAKDWKMKDAVFSGLERVLSGCRSLRGFGLYDGVPFLRVDKPHDWLMSIPEGILFVDWLTIATTCESSWVIDRISKSVVALRFEKVLHLDTSDSSPFASLPNLTHLSMPEELCGFGYLLGWSMPSLTHLCVEDPSSATVECVIDRVRNSLRSVFLGPTVSPDLLSQIATAARNLEEYVYRFDGGMTMERAWALVQSHPSLKSIVVQVGCPTTAQLDEAQWESRLCIHLQPLAEGHFPKLRHIGFVGINPYLTSDKRNRARLDKLLNACHASGIEVKYLGQRIDDLMIHAMPNQSLEARTI